jgi:hypothetical protein
MSAQMRAWVLLLALAGGAAQTLLPLVSPGERQPGCRAMACCANDARAMSPARTAGRNSCPMTSHPRGAARTKACSCSLGAGSSPLARVLHKDFSLAPPRPASPAGFVKAGQRQICIPWIVLSRSIAPPDRPPEIPS